MEEELRRLLHKFLQSKAILEDISDWIARNIWDAPNVENSLVDQVAHLLAFWDDSLLSEDDFREGVHALLSTMVLEVDLSIAGADPTARTYPPEMVRVMRGQQVAA